MRTFVYSICANYFIIRHSSIAWVILGKFMDGS